MTNSSLSNIENNSFFGTSSKNLSIVIQGPVCNTESVPVTYNLILSLKKYFPEAEIIFSTWEHEDTSSLDCMVIQNKDPGIVDTDFIYLRNAKRLILSTYEGIKRSSRKYCLKIRSDALFDYEYSKNIKKNYFSKDKINLLIHSTPGIIFLIDDKLQFGPKKKLLSLWSVDFDSIYLEIMNIFLNTPSLKKLGLIENKYLATEQILCISILDFNIEPSGGYFKHVYNYLSFARKNFYYLNALELGFSSSKISYKKSFRLSIYVFALRNLPISLLTVIFYFYAYAKMSKNLH